MQFEWDENKNQTNIAEHEGIDFNEASKVFSDFFALDAYDDAHSTDEEKRFNRIGLAGKQILFIVYTVVGENTPDETYRIISARLAEPEERDSYAEEKFGSGYYE